MALRRHSSLVSIALVAMASSLAMPAFSQDFDPRGRHHPPTRPHPGGRPSTHPGPVHPTPGSDVSTETPDAGASKAVLLERYMRIVIAQPGAPFPLQRLSQLYRERDGNLTKLVGDLQARITAATTPKDQYPPTVALAGLAKIDGRADDAVQLYQKAIALSPNDASAIQALGHLLADRGDAAGASEQFSRALALTKNTQDREQLLRTLMGLALDQKNWDAAKADHRELVKMSPQSLFVRGELGHELFTRGEFARAEDELSALVTAAQGDNRALAPALRDLGRAQAKAGETEKALASLKRALGAAGESSVRAEVYETIGEIYRADQRLPILVKELEDQHPTDYARLALLGSLYEETGDPAGALKAYARALAVNPRQIELRLKMVHLLQAQGDLDKAIVEYEALVRSAPQNPQFVFEECDALLQRGDRARALSLLTALEARAGTDDDVLGRLAEFYARIGETDRSTHVLQRLASVAPNDPSHLVDLGDRYFQDGNTALAVSTWKRILATVTPRARALAALGDVYLDHDMTSEALAVLKEAGDLDPNNAVYKRQLATALERSHDYAGARAEWQKLWARGKTTNDHTLLRESRSRIVALWGLEHVLEAQIAPLNAFFQRAPPDLEAGRMLAEVSLRLRKLGDAETTLRKVIELDPGDVDSYLALERALVQDAKLEEAIAVLEKLVVADPKRARELYQRMATYAVQIYKDEDAVRYAARAVELNPEDAEGHRRLGEMYRQRQDIPRAVLEFRAAIAKNERLYPVYFELADLLLAQGSGGKEIDEADGLLRHVVRAAPDEELVARAARASMQINLGRGQLESLESDLLPLTIAHPDRPIYRRLLVEIYGNLTYPLVQRVRAGSVAGQASATNVEDAVKARAQLAKIGGRAVKPLLDALSDADVGQQKVAIDVLSYIENKNAGPALFSYASAGSTQGQSEAPLTLRTRAMIACGALRDDALLPRYGALLFPKARDEGVPTDAVATAAAWAVAKLEDARALPLERKLLNEGTPEMRAFAALGIAAAHDRSASVQAELIALAKAPDAGNVARAAAAYALGELNADAALPTLLLLAQGSDALPREMALLALSRMSKAHGADSSANDVGTAAMADALFAESEGESAHGRKTASAVRRAAAAALTLVAARANGSAMNDRTNDPLPLAEDPLDAEATLRALVPASLPLAARLAALDMFQKSIAKAGLHALGTSRERASAVLEALGDGGRQLVPLITREEDTKHLSQAIDETLEPGILPLVRHPDVDMRMRALGAIAASTTDGAEKARIAALSDESEAVRRVAIGSLGGRASEGSVAALSKVLSSDSSWAMRVLAAEALGRMGKAQASSGAANATKLASSALTHAATDDSFALVRESALEALVAIDPASARPLAAQRASKDPEPRVRETAARLVHSS